MTKKEARVKWLSKLESNMSLDDMLDLFITIHNDAISQAIDCHKKLENKHVFPSKADVELKINQD